MCRSESQVGKLLLDGLLADPLIQMVMKADRVGPDALRRLLEQAAARNGASGPPVVKAAASLSLCGTHSPGYRPGVGTVLLNAHGEIFVGRRIAPGEVGWQMPQGGIEPGEMPRGAALRGLREEIGDNVEILAESGGWLRHDVPPSLLGTAWDGRWRGQEQKWFAMRFRGAEREIHIATAHPEFCDWRWAPAAWVQELIVSFKHQLYEDVVGEFGGVINTNPSNKVALAATGNELGANRG